MKKSMNHSSSIMIKHPFRNKVSMMMFLSMFFLMSEVSAEKLITYPAPEGYAKSLTYIVTVNGKPSPVYDARINDPDNCGYTYFDFEGTVHIIVTVPAGFESVKIRPLSAGIQPTVKGNIIEFDMTSPKKLCMELNGKLSYPLFIFANPLEINPPKEYDRGVLYFVPGFHDAGQIDIKSNETVYISGGAVVKGYFTSSDATHIKILGRGIMDAHENNTGMISFNNCTNVIVEGIFIIDQPTYRWTTTYSSCDSVLVKNCDFIHPNHTEKDPGEPYYYYCGSIGIVNGDSCEVHNIRYEDIRIEDPAAKLISLKIMKTQWNKDKAYGRIHDIYFKNILVIDGNPAPSEIISTGLDDFYDSTKVRPGQLIENVTFENLNILGKTIMNVQEGGFIVYPSAVNLKFIK